MTPWRRDTLTSGLRVSTLRTPHLHGAMVAVYVGTGSRHERSEQNGVSHFLEHILFRGCERYPESEALHAAVESVGGSLNGATTRDHAYYYTPAHPEGIEPVLDALGAMLTAPLVREVELEREVILEEILDEVDESGRLVDLDVLSKRAVFADHPLALPIAGSRETVERLSEADLRAHHASHYGTANLKVVAAGPLDHDRVLHAVERHFADLPRGARPAPHPACIGSAQSPRLVHVRHTESQTEVRLTYPTVSERHPDFPALVLATRILDDGLASRLQQEVVERRGLAYSVSAGLDGFDELSLLEIEASATHGKVPRLVSALLGTLERLGREPVGSEELARAKQRYRYGVAFMQDSVADLVGWMGDGEIHDTPIPLEERVAAIEAVDAETLRRVVSDTIRRDNLVAVTVGGAEEAAVRAALEEGAR